MIAASTRLFLKILILLSVFTSLALAQHPDRWPRFRGEDAKGINEKQNLPLQWDGESMANIAWKVRVPGLGLSSPTVWDGKIFLTSAVTHVDEPFLQVGLYGESPENIENYDHKFTVFCFDAKTGKTLWEKVAVTAVPKVMRHIKGSHANCTVALDGRHVVAFFASEGLYCYDMKGSLKWKKDFGMIDAGPFDAVDLQWGFASSPILYDNKVYVLCDARNQHFIAALDADTGEEIWRTERTDVPTWGSPVIVHVDGKAQVVVNGWHRRAGYDALTGSEIWFMDGGGDVPTPTPFEALDHIFFSSAHGRQRPLYAIKKTAVGDITLQGRETSNEYVTWANLRRGAYQPTPLVYGDILYVGGDNGILAAYKALTGEEIYRDLAGGVRGAYSASAVAADGRIYFNDEFGKIHVIQAGSEYKHLATNVMGDELMATPAIAGKSMFIRTRRYLWAVRDKGDKVAVKAEEKAEPRVLPVKPFTPPQGELSDPKEILRIAGQACEAIPTPRYTLFMEGTDALRPYTGQATVTLSAVGEVMRAEGKASIPGGPADMPFYVGFNGSRYYAVNSETKTLHVDLEPGVLGPIAGLNRFLTLGKFGESNGFASEIEASNLIELKGIMDVDGTACYEIYVEYPGEGSRPDTWFIGIEDFLPKKYMEHHTMPGGATGLLIKRVIELVPEPRYAKGFFEIPQLEGYTTTNRPLGQ